MSVQSEITRLASAKTAIATAIEGKGVTVPDGTLLDGIAPLIESIETGGGASLDIITATLLPSAVVDGQAIIITPTTPGKIILSYATPSDPVSGDIWVHIVDNEGYTLSVDGAVGIRITPGAVMQFNGSIWEYRNAYIGVSGEWKLFSTLSPLSSLTWTQIIAIANSGEDPSTFFAVGDEHDLLLTTGEVVTVVIGDFNHNTITGTSNKAAIAFTFKNCLNDKKAINASSGNAEGWHGSRMRTTIMPEILDTFPAELKADGAIKYVNVLASAGSQSTSLVTSSDRLRLHSIAELGLSYSYAASGEGTSYAYYTSGNRVKTVNGAVNDYWTRSPSTLNVHYFCFVNVSGNAAHIYSNDLRGVACGFDI